jgi:hypothetical protein
MHSLGFSGYNLESASSFPIAPPFTNDYNFVRLLNYDQT